MVEISDDASDFSSSESLMEQGDSSELEQEIDLEVGGLLDVLDVYVYLSLFPGPE